MERQCDVCSSSSQKYLGPVLHEKLNCDELIQSKISKCNKVIGITMSLSTIFPMMWYCQFKRLSLGNTEYANIIYSKPDNHLFCQRIKNVQYKTYLVISETIQGISHNKRH